MLENNLKRGVSTNCGCVRRIKVGALNRSHGAGAARILGSRAASVWLDMHRRCKLKTHKRFKDWGGRGIKVCKKWSGKFGFKHFLADMGEPLPGQSIERKDNNVGYSPDNCRWASRIEQQNNMRSNVHGWFDGKLLTAAQIARRVGLDRSTVAKQIKKGMYGRH